MESTSYIFSLTIKKQQLMDRVHSTRINYFILLFLSVSKLNIVNEKMYEVLSMVYQEFLELFDTDVFHMGGDEVNMNCYNTSQEIRDYLGVYVMLTWKLRKSNFGAGNWNFEL